MRNGKYVITVAVVSVLSLVQCKSSGKTSKSDDLANSLSDKSEEQLNQITVPVISNEKFWGTYDSKPVINCKYENCFPKDFNAVSLCDMRCLFTTQGFGLPEGFSRAFEGKKPVPRDQEPSFILAYGPPASGKGSILKYLKKFHPSEFKGVDQHTVSVNVDEIFQKGKVGEAYASFRENIIAKIESPERRQLYTQRLYVYYRWVADQIADGILNAALAGRYNVLWETTGASLWPRREIARINSYRYKTLVVYPLAATKSLIERTIKRANETGQEAAPAEEIRKTVELSQKNLIQLLPATKRLKREACPAQEKFGEDDADMCRSKRVLLIDNTRAIGEEKEAFDTHSRKIDCQLLLRVEESIQMQSALKKALSAYVKCGED